jgi:proline dehydrogenase
LFEVWTFFSFLVRRWIAGQQMEDALDKAEKFNEQNMEVLINQLGEGVEDQAEAEEAADDYSQLLRDMNKRDINGSISVKLTHFGLCLDKELCLDGMQSVVSQAKRFGTTVWIDMEHSRFTDDTIDIFFRLLGEYEKTALCIQSNLKRSEEDIREILERDGRIRLVKGAYKETPEIAYQPRDAIDRNFEKLMELLLEGSEGFAVASHDQRLVDRAVELNREYGRDLEFQFLMGIRRELHDRLVDEGRRVSLYIPYGEEWLEYVYRRVREKPANLLLVARSILP